MLHFHKISEIDKMLNIVFERVKVTKWILFLYKFSCPFKTEVSYKTEFPSFMYLKYFRLYAHF